MSPDKFNIVLLDAGEKPVMVIKAVRAITGLSLKEAKDMVDNVPSIILGSCSWEDGNAAYHGLCEAGAIVDSEVVIDYEEEVGFAEMPELDEYPEVHVKRRRWYFLWLLKS
tara:strand:+ start:358 stop:690 length:333 start_codon:yes stop_codon:yes gene_type:complete